MLRLLPTLPSTLFLLPNLPPQSSPLIHNSLPIPTVTPYPLYSPTCPHTTHATHTNTHTPVQFALLYTLYAAPNVILPFFGGYFVDRYGVCLCLLVFTGLVAAGQAVVALGFWWRSWDVIFVGRCVCVGWGVCVGLLVMLLGGGLLEVCIGVAVGRAGSVCI